jgi:hypothetical protein
MKTVLEFCAYAGWKKAVRIRWHGWELVAPYNRAAKKRSVSAMCSVQ